MLSSFLSPGHSDGFVPLKFPNQFPVRSLKRENYVGFMYVWAF